MSQAGNLLLRLSEATTTKLQFHAPSKNISLVDTSNLKKQNTVGQKSFNIVSEQPSGEQTQTKENALHLTAGLGMFNEVKVIFIEAEKTKPFDSFIIARKSVDVVSVNMAELAVAAADKAKEANFVFSVLLITGNFSSGKETRRFRQCVSNTAKLVGGRVLQSSEHANEQLYVIG